MNSYSAPPMTIDTNDDYAGLFMELTLQKKKLVVIVVVIVVVVCSTTTT
jgi:hypothetical protein